MLSRRFGVANTALDWCLLYLSKRTQTDPYTTDCSAPQGSVLGPLKFVSYTEDSADLITVIGWDAISMLTTLN